MMKFILFTFIVTFSSISFSKSLEESMIEFKKMEYGDYSSPIKVSDYESFLYVYTLLLNYEITSPLPKEYSDKLIQLRDKCKNIGRMQTSLDFLLLNKEFTTESVIQMYENNGMLKQYKVDVGDNCRAINELLKKK